MSGPYPTWSTGTAAALARLAHTGQVDKAGKRYIEHPAHVNIIARAIVVNRGLDLDPEVVSQVAWLHDVAEDTRFTHEMMSSLGVPVEVGVPLRLLDRGWDWRRDQGTNYYARIVEHPVALVVKEADIRHNLDPERLGALDEATQRRLRAKYAFAIGSLGINPEGLL